MSKIVKAINVMVSNPESISSVLKGQHQTEYFFKYNQKHSWSILKNSDAVYFLHYYPGIVDLSAIASIGDVDWEHHGPQSVSYNTKDLATRESIESFRDLYATVQEKAFGMDKVLDEIIDNDFPF